MGTFMEISGANKTYSQICDKMVIIVRDGIQDKYTPDPSPGGTYTHGVRS